MYEQLVDLYDEMEQEDEVTEYLIYGRAKISRGDLLDFDSRETASFLDQYIGRSILSREARMLGRSLCMASALGDTLLMQAFLKAKVDKAFQDSSTCLEDWPDEGQFAHLLPPLMSAALTGREEAVALLLDAGVDVDSLDLATGLSALHVVGYQGLGNMVKYLGSRGANLNLIDRHGRTPLHCAIYGESRRGGRRQLNLSSARVLLSEGADVNAVSGDGSTPLHIAVYTYQVEATRLLLQNGASMEARRRDGKTVLDFLYRKTVKGSWCIDQGEIFSILLRHGAFRGEIGGSTPLHNVVKFQNHRYVRFMLGLDPLHTNYVSDGDLTNDQGPDFETEFPELSSCNIDGRDNEGRTPLHIAAMGHRSDIIEALVQAGADVRLATPDGSTPLHIIMKEGGLLADCTEHLLDVGAEVDARDNERNTPLHLAAAVTEHSLQQALSAADDLRLQDGWSDPEEDHHHPLATPGARLQYLKVPLLESWDLLLARMADINAVNDQSRTPLHIAVENRNWTLIAKLLKAGASRDLADVNGRKPIEIAQHNRDHKAEKLFGLDLAGLEEVIVARTGDTVRPDARQYC